MTNEVLRVIDRLEALLDRLDITETIAHSDYEQLADELIALAAALRALPEEDTNVEIG